MILTSRPSLLVKRADLQMVLTDMKTGWHQAGLWPQGWRRRNGNETMQRQMHPAFVQWSLLVLLGGDGHFVSVAPENGVTIGHVSALMLKYLQRMWLRNMVKIRTADL